MLHVLSIWPGNVTSHCHSIVRSCLGPMSLTPTMKQKRVSVDRSEQRAREMRATRILLSNSGAERKPGKLGSGESAMLSNSQGTPGKNRPRRLLLCLDGVPHAVIQSAKERGLFDAFGAPSRLL